ncbi:MAG: mechanosensitive ion channel [Sphingobium sp.]
MTPNVEEAGRELLDTHLLSVGGTGISIGTLVGAATILAIAVFAAWAVRLLVKRAQVRLGEARMASVYIGGQVIRYIIVFAGLAAAVSTLGVDLSTLSLFAGALGVGIGLGLQDIVKNFVCGIVLLFDRSIEVGDYVELENGTNGIVSSIGPRATNLMTNDNVDIMVPNANLLNGQLTNWTRNRGTRRIRVPFGVAYGSDKDMVKAAALAAARSVPFTMPDDDTHKTQVWLTKFNDSSLDFELVVWPTLAAVKRPGSMMAAYCWAIDDALREHGIEIPFPQRDIHIRSFFGEDREAAMDAFHGRTASKDEGGRRRAEPSTSSNDAAEDIRNEPE